MEKLTLKQQQAQQKSVVLQTYEKSDKKTQLLFYLCASVPKDKKDIAINFLANLIKGDDSLLKEAISKAAGAEIENVCKVNEFKTPSELLDYFSEGKKFVLPFRVENSAIQDSFFIIKSHENSLFVANHKGDVFAKFDVENLKNGEN